MARLCGNPMLDEQQELMRLYESERLTEAMQVSKPCARCHQVTELEECPFCLRAYCDGCSHEHYCTVEILRGAQ